MNHINNHYTFWNTRIIKSIISFRGPANKTDKTHVKQVITIFECIGTTHETLLVLDLAVFYVWIIVLKFIYFAPYCKVAPIRPYRTIWRLFISSKKKSTYQCVIDGFRQLFAFSCIAISTTMAVFAVIRVTLVCVVIVVSLWRNIVRVMLVCVGIQLCLRMGISGYPMSAFAHLRCPPFRMIVLKNHQWL